MNRPAEQKIKMYCFQNLGQEPSCFRVLLKMLNVSKLTMLILWLKSLTTINENVLRKSWGRYEHALVDRFKLTCKTDLYKWESTCAREKDLRGEK